MLPSHPHLAVLRLAFFGLFSTLVACSTDASPSTPDAMPDAPPSDAVFDDASPSDVVFADAPPADTRPRVDDRCIDREFVDLDLRGVRNNDVTNFVGTNVLAPTLSPFVASCGGARPASVVGFRYTVRARARLIVSTMHTETDANFDTVVWAQRECAVGAPSLGCNDDVRPTSPGRTVPEASRFHSFFSTTSVLEPGTTVYLFVGSYAPTLGPMPTGTFRLSVTEALEGRADRACDPWAADCVEPALCRPSSDDLSDYRCVAPLGEGDACDPRAVRNVCSEQTFCRTTASVSRCERRGVLGAQCRTATPRCDGDAVCSASNTCVSVVPAGGVCDRARVANECVSGTWCSNFDGAPRCLAAGSRGAVCRSAPNACDNGLQCSYSVCVPALPIGSPCDASGSRNVCANGHCPYETSRCAPLGVRGAPCRASGALCDAGLRCNASVCVPEVAVGALCDGSGSRRPTSLCVEGAVCLRAEEGARCVRTGVMGAPCRSVAPWCDAGLGCGNGRCVPVVARNEPCDASGMVNTCVVGTRCTVDGATSRCLDGGALGRYCRSSEPRCDNGLMCDGTYCRTRVEIGAACESTVVCAPSSTCRMVAGVSRCVADGSLGGRCELSSSCPGSSTCGRCGFGLDCGAAFICVPEVAVGAPCDPTRMRDGCGTGASCITERGESRCVADGTLGGACARGEVRCAPGLRCDGTMRCVQVGVATGAKCDPAGRWGVCAAGSSCRYRDDASYCLADGSRGASRRTNWPPCDAGLRETTSGLCLEGLPLGSVCDIAARANVCASGTNCIRGDRGDRCVADGVAGGRCRAQGVQCDAGLGCDVSYSCVAALSLGATCDPARRDHVCVRGTSCVAGMSGARCVLDGVVGGRCRNAEPSCDTGLVCATPGVCRVPVAIGAGCGFDTDEGVCPAGTVCLESDTGRRCSANGSRGGLCRNTSTPCDEGLSCSTAYRCFSTVAIGALCDPEGARNACVMGTTCRTVAGVSRCVANGILGGACRTSAPRCDAGLSCAPESASAFPQRSCVAAIPDGGACNRLQPATSRCVDGSACIGAGAMGICTRASYTAALSTATFVDACLVPGATVLTMGPSLASLPTTLPFAFTYFGTEYPAGSALTVGSTGWLRFGATALRDTTPDELPVLFPDNTVFALWTQTPIGGDTTAPGRVCLASMGAPPSRVYVVTWSQLHVWGFASYRYDVELQLREGTHTLDMLYRLPSMAPSDPAVGATVGLQGPGGTSVVQRCGGTVRAATPCTRALLRDTRFSL